jgi:predicted house-cleaning noncanonical NTP pyrophosphatase (MazG superfamily)
VGDTDKTVTNDPAALRLPKLVRDYIPEMLRELGRTPHVKVLQNDKDYLNALNNKLREEVTEYFVGFELEELADVVEVVEALHELLDKIAPGELERVRSEKREKKGGFTARQYLMSISGDE